MSYVGQNISFCSLGLILVVLDQVSSFSVEHFFLDKVDKEGMWVKYEGGHNLFFLAPSLQW